MGSVVMDELDRLRVALAYRYHLDREIGRGGMATVYLAHDKHHGRAVAIKVLRPELGAALGSERFLREIQIEARLQHPHILPLHDSGTADGLLYYVMPYVEGESLRERIRREKQLPVDEALRIAREVADALEYAHQQGVVHRDIKPGNILLSGGHAIVADFGIAKAISAVDPEGLTESGIAVGTPEYMSPEQGSGDADADPRTDIYASGASSMRCWRGSRRLPVARSRPFSPATGMSLHTHSAWFGRTWRRRSSKPSSALSRRFPRTDFRRPRRSLQA